MWLTGLLAWAFFTKNAQKKVRLLRGVFFFTIVLTNPFLLHQTYRLYETPIVPTSDLRDTADIAIVLGGFSNLSTEGNDQIIAGDERINFNEASNRLIDAVVLYKKGLVKKLLISGGDGKLLRNKTSEALRATPFLLSMGVRESDILLESNSRNTHENALFSKQLLESQGIKTRKILLITSAYHMPRSIGCFRRVGLQVTPFPAHFIAEQPSWAFKYWLKPDGSAFFYWEALFKEWIGYGAYWLKGYI
ncbi:MAG: YdcF family protein [Saprospiraceae bacterium]|nr:YdcF family protein [Saprospiraceae bacterium]